MTAGRPAGGARTIDSGHHVAEENPTSFAAALVDFPTTGLSVRTAGQTVTGS